LGLAGGGAHHISVAHVSVVRTKYAISLAHLVWCATETSAPENSLPPIASFLLVGGVEDPFAVQGGRCSCSLILHLRQGDGEAALANPQARLHRHLIYLPLRARSSSSVLDGE
jgi:hypothetical protein